MHLDRAFLEQWEAKIASMRPSRAPAKNTTGETVEHDNSLPTEEDKLEPGMKVPNSVLNSCGNSFIAADGDRVKASSQFFPDTGYMALLCRHDRAIFIASMWTAGEKQFYAYALMDALLKDLPQHWRVGLLYDIACQLHRSLVKWDFMPDWVNRLEFGVSIFHAYGHQWVCQLFYHPRKSSIWGLSDGEGCERFWSELRKLIPGLRVAGYHRRLFIVDLQIEHLDEMKEQDMGKWLQERVHRAHVRKGGAEDALGTESIEYLLCQFKEQQEHQRKPVARQSQSKGARAIEHIISMENSVESLKTLVQELVAECGDAAENHAVHMEVQDQLAETRLSIKKLETNIKRKTAELQLQDRKSYRDLSKLKKDKWINLQLNLRVLRDQILVKLRQRKFELSSLERAHVSRSLDEQTRLHVEKAVKARSPGIQATVRKYNERRAELVKLRGKNNIRKDAYVPPALEMEGLYKLDVDQDIWQDPASSDMAEFPDGVPAWLGDEGVRTNIRRAQELQNCEQEILRCCAEQLNLQTWVAEEYAAVQRAYTCCQDEDVAFQLILRLRKLFDLAGRWEIHTRSLPCVKDAMMDWPQLEPPPNLLDAVYRRQVTTNGVAQERTSDSGSVASSDDDEQSGEVDALPEAEDIGFLDIVDRIALANTELGENAHA